MSLVLDETQILKAINDSFMNQIQVITTLYAKYNPHMLGLLEDATYEQRVRRLNIVIGVYTRRIIEAATVAREVVELKELMESLYEYEMIDIPEDEQEEGGPKRRKVKKKLEGLELEQYEYYQYALRGSLKWYKRQLDALSISEGHFAIFRSIALVEAFKAHKKKASQVVGVQDEQIKAAKKELGKLAKDSGEKQPIFAKLKERAGLSVLGASKGGESDIQISEEDRKKAIEAGLSPDEIFMESVE